jgi:hypothetical protein
MAAQQTRSFGREALAIYLAAALIVFGTWAASRYLILRKFENIEQNEISRNIEVMRKALLAKNTDIEMASRDYARWDDMYTYVSTLDANFEYQNFSEAGLDEMNVDLVWVLDPQERLLSSFENDTDDALYNHPASAPTIAEIARLTPVVRSVLDQEGTLRLVLISGVPHVIAAHTILHSDRSGPAAGAGSKYRWTPSCRRSGNWATAPCAARDCSRFPSKSLGGDAGTQVRVLFLQGAVMEGGQHQTGERARIVRHVPDADIVAGLFAFGQIEGAEQKIPEDDVAAVIGVAFPYVLGMVITVIFR